MLRSRTFLTELAVQIGDIIRFHKESQTVLGSILWLSGEELIVSSRKILEAGAKAQVSKKAYFGNKNWTFARQYLESLRMGQTEEGSYVVQAFAPTGLLSSNQELPIFTSPTGRDVTDTVVGALEATRHTLDEFARSGSNGEFDAAVEYGVSYELVNGVTGLVQQSDGADITVEWTDFDAGRRSLTRIEFSPSDLPALSRAASRYSAVEPAKNVTIVGSVTLLDRPRPGTPGVIRMSVLKGSEARKIRVRLEEEQYERAIDAHRRGMALQVTGRQELEGHLYWLYDPFDLQIIPIDPDPLTHLAAEQEELLQLDDDDY